MKKTIITVFAFLVVFGFTITGAMAQTWTWNGPYLITSPPTPESTKYIEIAADPKGDALLGIDDKNGVSTIGFLADPSTSISTTDTTLASAVDLIVGPNHVTYVIDNDTVGTREGAVFQALDQQPNVPEGTDFEAGDAYKFIAAGMNGKLYVLFEKSGGSPQYLLVGSSPTAPVAVRFTPRKLNLGSNGKWVSCAISNLPAGYTVDPNSVCITAIDGAEIEPICRVDGPVNVGETLKVKFPRTALADAITTGGNSVELTVKGDVTVGEEGFEFSGTDTINTKAKKVK